MTQPIRQPPGHPLPMAAADFYRAVMTSLIVTIAVVCLIAWAITTILPIPALAVRVIWIIVAICLAFYVLEAFGLIGRGVVHDVPVPQLR